MGLQELMLDLIKSLISEECLEDRVKEWLVGLKRLLSEPHTSGQRLAQKTRAKEGHSSEERRIRKGVIEPMFLCPFS